MFILLVHLCYCMFTFSIADHVQVVIADIDINIFIGNQSTASSGQACREVIKKLQGSLIHHRNSRDLWPHSS